MTSADLASIHFVTVLDEHGQTCTVPVAGEKSLTLVVDDRKIATLMTLGAYPEALAIGYLRNQQIVKKLSDVKSIHVNCEEKTIQINTLDDIDHKKTCSHPIITGCGQGATLSTNELPKTHLAEVKIKQSLIYAMLHALTQRNNIHRQAGGVHSCALCQGMEILAFVEDVGRHNAADTIAGLMWLHNWLGNDKCFYTTGRLTSEIVMKVANTGISTLLSRSGVTYKGIQIAQEFDITLIAHAKKQHFLVFNGKENIIFDACPSPN